MVNNSYIALARKYRPQGFDDLKGQETMVQIIENSFSSGRIHHAYIFTGIRGIGKTTTARIIAKALNCIGEDGSKVSPDRKICNVCNNCLAITEDRHPDVLEMDAASQTGIEDVKEIIDFARYLPVSARHKVVIIDEVHMLSTKAFNALLKTLEEPPKHIIFIFATTEIRKIPITILSRCQQFQLRRFSNQEIVEHLYQICSKENISVEEDALRIIASVSSGSMRDAISILDQAINYSFHENAGKVSGSVAEEVVGRASNINIIKLLHSILSGDVPLSFSILSEILSYGTEAIVVCEMLLEVIHAITLSKNGLMSNNAIYFSANERKEIEDIGKNISIPIITRAWNMLIKGIEEIKSCSDHNIALEMLVIRLCYVAHFPTPIDMLASNNINNNVVVNNYTPSMVSTNTGLELKDFSEIIRLFQDRNELVLAEYLRQNVSLVNLENNQLEISLLDDLPKSFPIEIKQCLEKWTNQKWQVILSEKQGDKPLIEQLKDAKLKEIELLSSEGKLKQILDTFPGSKIVSVQECENTKY